MLIVNQPGTDPYFNIAAEEYILKNFRDDIFMLWKSRSSIIVGKHQNTLAEINYPFVKRNNIPVIRRISGGGTVFHDPGNLNYTFIKKGEKGKLVNFKLFISPVIEALNKMGIPAVLSGKNDITVYGKKISGNAEHIYKNKVLHHGTLLFSSELTKLNNALASKEKNFSGQAIKSNRSVVTNISELLPAKMTLEDFGKAILDFIVAGQQVNYYDLSGKDISGIKKLVKEKYSTWKWNYGYSPQYIFKNKIKTGLGESTFQMKVKNGVIISFDATGYAAGLGKLLTGTCHNEVEILKRLKTKELPPGLTEEEIITALF